MSLKKQLERYKKHLKASHADSSGQEEIKPKVKTDDRHEKELMLAAKALNAEVCYFGDQYILKRVEQLTFSESIGEYTARDFIDVVKEWNDCEMQHPLSSRGLNAEDLLFFDTETTGLGAGSGHMIFLIGTARINEAGVQLTQYFLPGPGHEAAFYYYFLKETESLQHLVTYNGKAFDWPRVKTRHQFVKDQVPSLPLFGHFDLLHASRRLWKKGLVNTRLETIEKEILHMDRGMDIPGHMAPFLYFQFLKRPNAALVSGVMDHNKEDTKSLIALYTHLSRLILNEDLTSVNEAFEIARWHETTGEVSLAKKKYEQLLNKHPNDCEILKRLAPLYKKTGYIKEAKALYHILSDKEEIDSMVELAKIYEHQEKDLEKALYYTEKAEAAYATHKNLFQRKVSDHDIEKRKQRLIGKLHRR